MITANERLRAALREIQELALNRAPGCRALFEPAIAVRLAMICETALEGAAGDAEIETLRADVQRLRSENDALRGALIDACGLQQGAYRVRAELFAIRDAANNTKEPFSRERVAEKFAAIPTIFQIFEIYDAAVKWRHARCDGRSCSGEHTADCSTPRTEGALIAAVDGARP